MATVQSFVRPGHGAPPPALIEDGGGSLGDWLRRARERRGLTLERISIETKIPQRHLEALEHDDLAAMPPGFYQRAELRAYARAVGVDEGGALARLESATEASAPTAAVRSSGRTEEPTHRNTGTNVLIALVVALTGTVLWLLTADRTPTPAPEAQVRNGAEAVPTAELRAREQSPVAPAPPTVPSETVPGLPPEPAEPPPPAVVVTQLIITTQPAGARVTVNGIGWGSSPVTIRNLPPGAKRIRVSKDGYAAQERELQLDEGRQRALDIRLNSAQ